MHGLKENTDLTFLKGREVIQVAIGKDQVIFAFDEDVTISVEGQFEYADKASSSEWRPGSSQVAASAVSLLGTTVESVHGQADGTLKMTFSNGDRLVIRDVSSEYESYQITRPGQTIVV